MSIVRRAASRFRSHALCVWSVAVVALYLGIGATSASALPERFFGMTAQESMFDSETDWEALQNAGVQKFRMQISWKKINEAGGGGAGGWKNEWAWQKTYDRYFEKAAKHGIAILPYIYTRKDGNQAYYLVGGANYTEWLEFVWTVVQRYGQAGFFWFKHLNLPQYPVDTWEVWNEPNLSANCPSGACNGKQYGEFLVGTSKTIHQAQEAFGYVPKVLFGGLYQERWNYSITNYLAAAGLAPGIKTAYDGLSIHPYAFGQTGEGHNYSEKAGGVWSNIDSAYNAQFNGIGVLKPLWVTEVGWPITGTGADHVTEGEQAGLLSETYNWIKQHWSEYNIKYAAWFDYKDFSSDPNTRWDQHSGLRDVNGNYRESWYSYEAETGVPGWPPRWHGPGYSVGGTITASPDVTSPGPGQLDLYVRGTDGALWHRWWSGSAWSSWSSLGGYLKEGSGPGVVCKEWNTVDVFGRTTSNSIVNWYYDGSSWHGPGFTVEGNITSDPDAAAARVGQLDLFARGSDGSLLHRHWSGTAWSAWESLSAPGVLKEGSGPTAVSKEAGTLDVFGRAPNDSIVNWYYDGAMWHGPGYTVGGVVTSDPDVASAAPGTLDLFVRGSDGALWHRWWSGSAWSEWASLGGTLKEGTGPGAVSKSLNQEDVFGEAPNGSVVNWYFGP